MIKDMARREYEIATAYDVGLYVPKIQYLGDKTLAEINMIDLDKGWEVAEKKLAIEVLEGVQCSFVAFWSGEEFFYNTIIINDNYLMTGQQGICLPANAVTAFPGKSKKVDNILKKLAEKFMEKEAFKGFVTLDVTFKEDKLYYNRIKFSIIYDYLYSLSALSNIGVDTLLARMEAGDKVEKPDGFGCSLRLWEYPYGPANIVAGEKYVEEHHLEKADDCYVITSNGRTIKKAWKNLYNKSKDIDMCFRLDGDYKARWTYNQLKQNKYV